MSKVLSGRASDVSSLSNDELDPWDVYLDGV